MEKEIQGLKLQGLSPTEIINKGYKKSTVYKVFKGKLDNFVIVNYQVTGLKQVYNMVEMSLQPYRPPPPLEEIERARAEAELDHPEPTLGEVEAAQKLLGPVPSTDEGKFINKMFIELRKQAPGMFSAFKEYEPPKHPTMGMAVGPIQFEMNQQLYLTIDQYIALGSPSLLSLITLTVDRVKGN